MQSSSSERGRIEGGAGDGPPSSLGLYTETKSGAGKFVFRHRFSILCTSLPSPLPDNAPCHPRAILHFFQVATLSQVLANIQSFPSNRSPDSAFSISLRFSIYNISAQGVAPALPTDDNAALSAVGQKGNLGFIMEHTLNDDRSGHSHV